MSWFKIWRLTRQLRVPGPDPRRAYAADALQKIGVPALKVLHVLLNDHRRPDVAWSAAGIIAKIGDRSSVTYLIQALTHPGAEVRAKATKALAQIPDPRALEPLIRLLEAEGALRLAIDAVATDHVSVEFQYYGVVEG